LASDVNWLSNRIAGDRIPARARIHKGRLTPKGKSEKRQFDWSSEIRRLEPPPSDLVAAKRAPPIGK